MLFVAVLLRLAWHYGAIAPKDWCAKLCWQSWTSPENVQKDILSLFKANDVEKEDADSEPEQVKGQLGMDCMCEAELLSNLLQRMEQTPQTTASSSSAAPSVWPKEERGAAEEYSLEAKLPERCKLVLHKPQTASPNIQGILPQDQKWKGFNTHSRSFRPRGARSTDDARCTRSFEAAKAEVLAWLWSWHDSKAAGADGVPEPPAAKRSRQAES